MSVSLKKLAERCAATVEGNNAHDIQISGVAPPPLARTGELAYIADKKLLQEWETCEASAALIPESLAGQLGDRPAIVAKDVRVALAHILGAFPPPTDVPSEIHETAIVAPSASIGDGVGIGPNAVIDANTKIGDGTRIGAGCFIGSDVIIGDEALIHPQVYVGPRTEIGARVILHSGARIGADGFGYAFDGQQHVKIPHIGKVVLEDYVEVGANATIDRATMGETRIGAGTKIDNLVHIAHNVKTGQGCLLVGQVGISGSCDIGNGVVMAGQVGVGDHITIGDRVKIGAQSGIMRDIAAGERVLGSPTQPARRQLRIYAAILRLPEFIKAVHDAEKRIQALEEKA